MSASGAHYVAACSIDEHLMAAAGQTLTPSAGPLSATTRSQRIAKARAVRLCDVTFDLTNGCR